MRHVARQEQVDARAPHVLQLGARGQDVHAAERVAGMLEVAHEPVLDAPQERGRAPQPARDDRPARARLDPPRAQVAGGDPRTRLKGVGRQLREDVERAADRVPAVERALRAAQDLDAVEVHEIGEHHRRAREVNAVHVDGRAGVGAREDRVGPDAADRELAVAGVLREGQGRRLAGQVLDRLRLASTQLLRGQDADGERRRLQLALARLRRRDDDPLGDPDHQPEGDAHRRAARELDALLRRRESVWAHAQAVLAVRKVAEREPTVRVRRGSPVDGARQADRGVRDPAARRVLHRARDPTGLSRTKGVRRLQAGVEKSSSGWTRPKPAGYKYLQ